MTRKKKKKQLDMTNEDNASIRYLMKEMDPSEEVLMERAMMEDDDLLIEVECMRQTMKRVNNLPEVEPPAHLTESIIKEAVEYRRNKLNSSRFISSINLKYAAAALVVIGTTVGSAFFYDNNSNESPADTVPLTAAHSTDSGMKQTAQNVESVSSKDANIAPWVDRNDVLYFQDHYMSDETAFDSIIETSTDKLIPLKDPFIYNNGSHSLHLTGSSSNQ